MGVFTDHPHTAITEKINVIIESDLEPEVEVPELINTINLQYSGPTEAARAIRKKLKYGSSVKQQMKSVELLNALVVNGDSSLEMLYNDRKLIERLKITCTDKTIDVKLRKLVIQYVLLWSENFGGMARYAGLTGLRGELNIRAKRKTSAGGSNRGVRGSRRHEDFMADSAYGDEENDSDDDEHSDGGSRPGQPKLTQKQLNKKYKIPTINLTKEAPKIKLIIAEASQSSTDLINSITQKDYKKSNIYFDKCRIIRRKILRYLQLVDSEEFLGGLIHANEELVAALQKYANHFNIGSDDDDDDDSDSSDSSVDSLASSLVEEHARKFPTQLRRAPEPPRARGPAPAPAAGSITRTTTEDSFNPFGDSHEVDEAAEWK